ncbi:hypothetical protein BYT27DRAFT_7190071 [Phlegmacium glaucopus]|nr:hypothetical protein BYT27DRAFT_7190071 [Phlegmacium glaucopus]
MLLSSFGHSQSAFPGYPTHFLSSPCTSPAVLSPSFYHHHHSLPLIGESGEPKENSLDQVLQDLGSREAILGIFWLYC